MVRYELNTKLCGHHPGRWAPRHHICAVYVLLVTVLSMADEGTQVTAWQRDLPWVCSVTDFIKNIFFSWSITVTLNQVPRFYFYKY